MMLWVLFAVLAAAVVWAVTRPLLASTPTTLPTDDGELAVYRDQLAEIEAERAQGLLGGAEAEGARVELARRLIRRSEETQRLEAATHASSRMRQAALYAAAALPVIGIALYLAVGSPQLPGRPYASRLNAPVEQATAADLVARVEAHLRANPEDGRGWDVLAPVYMRMGNFTQAAEAFQRATRLLGESPKRLAGFARASIMLQNGLVGEPARQAYEKLRALEPAQLEPQVWLAIAREQDGDVTGAEAEYRRLLPGAEEPWKGLLEARLKSVSERLGKAAPNTRPADAMAAAAAMSPAERERFIGEMVDGLAARLKANGNDLQGWMRLVRSYMVLGRRDEATTALNSARGQFAGDEKSLAELNVLAQSLGLGS
ncbi:MAG: c-type cytochrome biogenesis protein CcmI [Hyphomicrobium sp.]|uniref:c-type cytochrome biogenesis protein CcmI n=1 Tax=Hyphomicrobium sp. TaxID=82 RepID=UPI0013261C53|nr:c-type cytochrome biogenesis protein CcmI [Hyphomicrobium sp.]KAB2937481.1 MAG: c-type cytochrome biogenesis protein CcmI [Hyphomicrobium sp.]MBZ0211791.1 c-type cytochrome biogenesis protein CcmI [Hyphomicrobium sp.]